MTISIQPFPSVMGSAITGVDVSTGVAREEFQKIQQALDERGVVVLRSQNCNDEQQLAFAEMFGPIDLPYSAQLRKDMKRRLANTAISDISNLDEKGELLSADDNRRMFGLANQLWHTDTSYKKIPTRVTLLSARELPPEPPDTEFADMRAAWDALPPGKQEEIEGLRAVHSIFHSRAQMGFTQFSEHERSIFPPVKQPLVRTHARTGRKSLYLAAHASHIDGMDERMGHALIKELTEFATRPEFIYAHKWITGDILIWDKSFTMHRARPFDDSRHRRVMHRIGVNELSAVLQE